jgi:hypothetical protein
VRVVRAAGKKRLKKRKITQHLTLLTANRQSPSPPLPVTLPTESRLSVPGRSCRAAEHAVHHARHTPDHTHTPTRQQQPKIHRPTDPNAERPHFGFWIFAGCYFYLILDGLVYAWWKMQELRSQIARWRSPVEARCAVAFSRAAARDQRRLSFK